jgi:hypothetical protein
MVLVYAQFRSIDMSNKWKISGFNNTYCKYYLSYAMIFTIIFTIKEADAPLHLLLFMIIPLLYRITPR